MAEKKIESGILSREKMQWVLVVILAACFAWGINRHFFSVDMTGPESSLNIGLFVGAIVLLYDVLYRKKAGQKTAFLFSFLYAIALCLGKMVYDANSIREFWTLSGFCSTVCSIAGLTAVTGACLSLVFRWITEYSAAPTETIRWKIFSGKYSFFVFWALIFILWLPCYLAYYPGNFQYDVWSQTLQAVGVLPYTKHHPPIHTYLWQLCISLENSTGFKAICVYSMVQMLFLSAVFSKLITFLIRRGVRNWIVLVTVLFTAFNPVMALFSFEVTKDVAVGGFFVLAMLQLCDLLKNPEQFLHSKKDCGLLMLYLLLCSLFRNNVIYAVILCVPFFGLAMRRYWKRLLPVWVIPILCYFVINGGVYSALGIAEGEGVEMLAVPMQQISKVVVEKDATLTEEEKQSIGNFFTYDSISTTYNPRFGDYIKGVFQNDYYEEHKADFIKLWCHLLFKYPKQYVDAFLSLNLPYWYPDSATVDAYSQRRYIETGLCELEQYPLTLQSKLPGLYKLYEKVASFEAFQDVPVAATVFSITTPLWLMLFCLFVLVQKKKTQQVLLLLPGLFFWLTFMAGPVSNFRYIFPIFCLYPVYIALMFDNKTVLSGNDSGDMVSAE